jgi:hypothetical protein
VLDYAQTVSNCDPSTATGTGLFLLNDARTELSYKITYSGLQGTETAAHFHNAPPGENGDIVRFLSVGAPNTGVWKSTDFETLSPEIVAELFAGNIYVVVHTTFCGVGEIRGNLALDPTPNRETSWRRLKAMYRSSGARVPEPAPGPFAVAPPRHGH